MTITGTATVEQWTLTKPFVIARGVIDTVELVVVELRDGSHVGRGECCPTPHYGETTQGVLDLVNHLLRRLEGGEDWDALHDATPAGAARNAIDCALWDLRAKRSGRSVAALLLQDEPQTVVTACTLSIDTPETMGRLARQVASGHPLIKVKIGQGEDDLARLRAVRAGAPGARLIVDVNEGWDLATLRLAVPELAALGIEMLEQPLPAGADAGLADIPRLVPIGADESCHVTADLDTLVGRYDVVNIKLDKTGGLTEALRLVRAAEARGLGVMVGCMIGTSLAMSPGMIVAQHCRYVDLDGPVLIGKDRPLGMRYHDGRLDPPLPELWG